MNTSEQHEITRILSQASDGDASALHRLMPLLYDELRALADGCVRQERPGHTLQATALVHEAFVKLVDQRNVAWQNRAHFFALAAQAMRRILVDHARGRQRLKRGGDWQKLTLDDSSALSGATQVDLLGLDDALSDLARLHERQAKIVELRFFGGLTVREVAEVIGVSIPTVESDWRMAKAWLKRELDAGPQQ
jgi:RNA polymerase sigma factor (TIGR02999 family)